MGPMSVPSFVRTDEVLSERYTSARALEHEMAHGNTDLIRALTILGCVGPFKTVSPWEYQDPSGKRLINTGGYSAVPFGDGYPPLVQFMQNYLEHLHTIGLPQQSASTWRAALEHNLVKLLASQDASHADSKVFFSNSGAEANEAAIKFAKATRPKAKHILNFRRAYHGKTQMTMSLTPNPAIQKDFGPLEPNIHTHPYGDLDAVKSTIKKLGSDNVVAIILEPLQGEAGVILPPEGFLKGISDICQATGIILIVDEIQSGLGRVGSWFASIDGGMSPDIITLAKPLGGGMSAVGATLYRKWIFDKVLGGLDCKRHSNTFGGNSLAMAVGLKSLEILVDENLPERSARMGKIALDRLKGIQQKYPEFITEVRGKGMLMAMVFRDISKLGLIQANKDLAELVAEASGLLALRQFYQNGLILNLSLNSTRTLRMTPALTMPEDLFNEMLNRVEVTARRNPRASRLLVNTPPKTLMDLVKFAT
ncbi:aspartate aminotransferase family protein [Deinococcus cellulosilyticus NBRC 106333 = KACC 11606]|uniref:Aspartate aminotransferase family protein n=2 Tax=Deinococcus cellulosilyticus TaxID=401558 RepID=A0A511N813_DEIC1|nr:aspartate aminotransferase family protein [Deinococcus cellulosilyticus NBRC 106333 = KACC 11606]